MTILFPGVQESTAPSTKLVVSAVNGQDLGAGAARALVTGSLLSVPNGGLSVGSRIKYRAVLTKTAVGAEAIATLGSITGGTLYTTGTYNAVALTGGTGTGATANITVAGGAVTVVTLVNHGTGYTVGDTLSASAANIGGSGSGFHVPVATIAAEAASTFDIGIGVAGTTADAATVSFGTGSQTAVADTATVDIQATVTAISATAGHIDGSMVLIHNLAATGFGPTSPIVVHNAVTNADDSLTTAQFIGLYVTEGASNDITVVSVEGSLDGITTGAPNA